MGFFKDLKDDLTEISEIDNVEEDEFIEDVDASLMENYLDANSEEVVFEEEADPEDELVAEEAAEEVVEEVAEPAAEDLVEIVAEKETAEEIVEEAAPAVEEEESAPVEEETVAPAKAEENVPVARETDATQVTIITRGTTINGSIISDCSLDVMGTINGDIECLGKLSISGTVVGNSSASDVFVNTKRLEGNIDSEGSVKIGLGTVVVGDIKAGSGVIAGAVKGDVEIAGPIVIDSTAVIKGNIKAKAVQMNNGAIIEGFCSLSNASVDIDNIFE